jgi:hypothetical protein
MIRNERLLPVGLMPVLWLAAGMSVPAVAAEEPKKPPPASLVENVAPETAEAVLGQRVSGTDGKDIGRLVDILVDADGKPDAAVIDFGGFLGVGSRKVVVHWSALRFYPADPKHKVVLQMTPDQIKAAPEYTDVKKPAPVVTPAEAVKPKP